MNSYNLDSLHRLTHECHAQRLHEADTERLARELRGTTPKRRRLRLTRGLALKPSRGAVHPRLEA